MPSTRLLAADERAPKAAIYGLNQAGRHTQELEEAWIVSALVREDGLSQPETAELLGRHKSWVCRRLAWLERLCVEAQAELRLGVLTAGLARQLTRLPVGNQAALLTAARRAALTTVEVQGVIESIQGKGCFISENNSPFKKQVREKLLLKEVDSAVVTAHHLQVGRDEFLALVKERLDFFERKAAQTEKQPKENP